ncbi:MAG: hypothetical protein Q9187_008056 [Circinaria calcarea]
MASSKESAILEHGFTAVPRDINKILSGALKLHDPQPLLTKDLPFPSSPLVEEVQKYAKANLNEQTYNHSMRVYYYGQAILRTQFPAWHCSPETYALACLLHDIGTAPHNLAGTLLSFEFHGGILALDLLATHLDAPRPQAEAVVEAIIRHQDLGTTGTITTLGQILQLATVLDNLGDHAEMVSRATVEDVVATWPRRGWSRCFAATLRREMEGKPWAHTTALGEDEFPDGVLANKVMEPYD